MVHFNLKRDQSNKGDIEKSLVAQGITPIGVDEVGRGCLAGPVYTCAITLDYEKLFALDDKTLKLIRDSKTLSSNQRQKIVPVIESIASQYKIATATLTEIDKHGILGATFVSMKKSLKAFSEEGTQVLVDGNQRIPGTNFDQQTIIGGDGYCYNIAAASILAKEARDDFMRKKALEFPEYGFESNMGYGTKAHMDGLKEYGPCGLHRMSFAPVQKAFEMHS
jgi:ribonuclease HII